MKQYENAIEYCNYATSYLKKPDGIAFLYNTFIEAYTRLGKIDLSFNRENTAKPLPPPQKRLILLMSMTNGFILKLIKNYPKATPPKTNGKKLMSIIKLTARRMILLR